MNIKNGLSSAALHGAKNIKNQDEITNYLEGWKRARADYENLSSRVVEEKNKSRREGVENTLRSLLVVLDYFDAAFATKPVELEGNPWVMGVQHIQKAFVDALNNLGVKTIDDIRVTFDPKIHEAVAQVESKEPIGFVVEIISKGYEHDGKVLRPARVKISKGSEAPADEAALEGNTASAPTSKTLNEKE